MRVSTGVSSGYKCECNGPADKTYKANLMYRFGQGACWCGYEDMATNRDSVASCIGRPTKVADKPNYYLFAMPGYKKPCLLGRKK